MILAGEPRMCPICGRMLGFYKDRYLCKNCWQLFAYEETVEHSHPNGLCFFTEKYSERCLWLICNKCGKTLNLMWEELDHLDKIYDEGNVAAKRQALEEWKKQVNLEFEEKQKIQELLERVREIGLDKVRLVEGTVAE